MVEEEKREGAGGPREDPVAKSKPRDQKECKLKMTGLYRNQRSWGQESEVHPWSCRSLG